MGVDVTLRGGSGDMLKSEYDPNLDSKIAKAQIFTDLDKSNLTNRTRRIFVCPSGYTTGTLGAYANLFSKVLLSATGQVCHGTFVMPNDFGSVGTVYLGWLREAVAGSCDINSGAYWASHDEPYNTGSDTDIDRVLDGIANGDIGITATGLDLTGVDKNDVVSLKVDRDANTDDNFSILGWLVEYTADM